MIFDLPALPFDFEKLNEPHKYVLIAQADDAPFSNVDPINYRQRELEIHHKHKQSSKKGETPEHLKAAEKRMKGVRESQPSQRSYYAKVEVQPYFSRMSGKSKNGGANVSVSSNNSSFYRACLGQKDGFQYSEVYLEGQYYDLEPAKNGSLDDSQKYTTSFGVNHRFLTSSVGLIGGLSLDSNFLFGGSNTSNLTTYNTQYLSPKLGVEGSHGQERNFHWQASYRYGINIDSPAIKTENKQELRAQVGYSYDYKNSTFDLSYDYRFIDQENTNYEFNSHEHGPTLSYKLNF